jgi:hypothetical protein
MKGRCSTCGHLIHQGCNYNQGRCPHQPPMINLTEYHYRYLTLVNTIKGWFKK